MTVLVLEGLIEMVTFEGAAASGEYLGKGTGERGWRLKGLIAGSWAGGWSLCIAGF